METKTPTATKNLTVVVAGSGAKHDIAIAPGTTAGDITRQLRLTGYSLAKDEQASSFFRDDENVYAEVKDGTKLWASTEAKVGVA
jgi:hypothetical protein